MEDEFKITAVRYSDRDDPMNTNYGVEAYQLNGDKEVTLDEALKLAMAGRIANVEVRTRDGRMYLRTIPDGKSGNNIQNLPTF